MTLFRSARLAGLLITAIVLAAPAAAQDSESTWQRIMRTKVLRIGSAPGQPMAFKDISNSPAPGAVKLGDDTWRGMGPNIGKLLADALGVKLEMVEGSDANSIAGLQANLIDAFLPVEGTPERAKGADFVPVSILWSAMTYYSRTDDAPTTWAALDDPKYRIGVVLGAHTDFFVKEHLPKARIDRFPDQPSQIAALQSGRVDGLVMVGTVATVTYGVLKTGRLVTPTPLDVTTNTAAIRPEMDLRWHNYLTTALGWYYTSGTVERLYDEFLAFRGIDPKEVLPVTRERWPR